jgi:predicted amidophosphoribosyltransferase
VAWSAALVRYEGVGRLLVAALKFGGNRAALSWWGEQLTGLLPGRPDVVTWAPTAPSRRRARGFDQAELLAVAVARRLQLRATPLLRSPERPPQTGLGAESRAVGPRFSPARPATGTVLLIDDVRTTGATLGAAADTLRQAGATAVWALSAAWTP